MLMRDLTDEVLGTGAGPGMWPGWGCQSVRCFPIFYRLISELSKQVNWPGPSWELRFSQPGLPWAGSQRPFLKPDGYWAQVSLHKQGSRCKIKRPGRHLREGLRRPVGKARTAHSCSQEAPVLKGSTDLHLFLHLGWGGEMEM